MMDEILVKEVLKTSAFFLILFILSAAVGFHQYDSVKHILLPEVKRMVEEMYEPSSKLLTTVNIFMNNLTVTLVMFAAGLTIVVPVLIISGNGFVLGFFARHAVSHEDIGLGLFIKGITLHGIFELPAMFISAALGVRIGTAFLLLITNVLKDILQGGKHVELTGLQTVMERMREGVALFICIVVPLLLTAAFVEIYVTGWLLGI